MQRVVGPDEAALLVEPGRIDALRRHSGMAGHCRRAIALRMQAPDERRRFELDVDALRAVLEEPRAALVGGVVAVDELAQLVVQDAAALDLREGPGALDALVAQVADKVKDLSVREIQIVDSGDGGSLAQVAAAYPAIVTEVLSTLKGLTGVDIKNLLTPVEGDKR